MKYCVCIICVIAFLFVFRISSKKSFHIQEFNTDYKETFIGQPNQDYKKSITHNELEQDLDMLVYYIKNGYIGFRNMKDKGFNSFLLCRHISEKYDVFSSIETYQVYNNIVSELVPYVDDSHFSIFFDGEFHTLSKSNRFYYTNTYVEKKESDFFLYESDIIKCTENMRYSGSSDNLFYYPAKGENIYIIGSVFPQQRKELTVSFDDYSFILPLYDDGNIKYIDGKTKYNEIETKDNAYISISSFEFPEINSENRQRAEKLLEKYANLGSRLLHKKNIILDLRGNLGGRGRYSTYFLYSLFYGKNNLYSQKNFNKLEKWYSKYFENQDFLKSPVTTEAHVKYFESTGEVFSKFYKELQQQKENPKTIIFKNRKPAAIIDKQRNHFKGNLIILVDRNTSSAAEQVIYMGKKLFGNNCIVIGENSAGCFEYGDNFYYELPNSKILLKFGCIRIHIPKECTSWHGEGCGFYPDFWSLRKDLNESIFRITHDEEMQKKLEYIKYGLQ